MRPSGIRASKPAATTTAPMTPPIRACDDDDGMPRHHVKRFQKMPPSRPARMIAGVMASGFTTSSAIVAATSSEMNAPTKFSSAARATAAGAGSARVAIDVAIALAVSWKPFVKSNARAVTTTSTRTRSEALTPHVLPARRRPSQAVTQ
jgi:hypothetical protein